MYTIDTWGNINCFVGKTGWHLWEGSIEAYWSGQLAASSSIVYGGKSSGEVGALDAADGKFKWSNYAASSSLYSKRAPDNITVLDGRVYVTTDAFSALNATTGEVLWEIRDFGVNGSPLKGNKVYVTTFGTSGLFLYRLDPDDGTALWCIEDVSFISPAVSYQGQVIMHNRTVVFSLDETTGASLWNHNIESVIYQPVAYNGLLVFEAADGYVYALHMSDGTLAWKTYVDSQNLTSQANSDNPLKALAIQIDTQNQRAIGGYAITKMGGAEYRGFLCNLDLGNGSIIWTTQLSADGDISHENALFNFVLTRSEIYLTTEFSDLWLINKSTGEIIKTQNFDHYILPPVVADNKVFAAADLRLIAYE